MTQPRGWLPETERSVAKPWSRVGVGVLLVIAGAILALALPEVRFFWFEGRPLGVLFIVIGALEAAEALFRRRRR